MNGFIAEIWRYPVKGHGREKLERVQLTTGECIPCDRRWAVLHEAAVFDDAKPEWKPCTCFPSASTAPLLQAVTARSDIVRHRLAFSHPRLDDLTVDPDDRRDADRFINWVQPLSPADRARPERLVQVPGRGMTDTDYPSVSVINLASHAEVSRKVGREISHLRWRGNIVLDGLNPWEETRWPGRRLVAGQTELEIVEPTVRCMATAASVRTGLRDADVLGALQAGWAHRRMGVYARVTRTGELRCGDRIGLTDAD